MVQKGLELEKSKIRGLFVLQEQTRDSPNKTVHYFMGKDYYIVQSIGFKFISFYSSTKSLEIRGEDFFRVILVCFLSEIKTFLILILLVFM